MSTLVTLSPRAAKAHAAKWFLAGFKRSGKGFHGEAYDEQKYPALKSLLLSEFERAYDEDRSGTAASKDAGNGSRPTRRVVRRGQSG